jgi:hypothetical protein
VLHPRQALIAALATAVLGAAAPLAYGQPAPPNDNYLLSTVIPQSQTTGRGVAVFHDRQDLTAATTQNDLFIPNQQGLPLGGGGREPLDCQGATFGHTIWYDLRPRVNEGVELKAAGLPNVIALYRYSQAKIVNRVGCQAASGLMPNDFIVPSELTAHDLYTLQVGGLQTSTGIVAGPVSFTAKIFPDHDADGVYDALPDACPFLPGIARLAGCPPSIIPGLHYTFDTTGVGGLFVTRFEVFRVPSGARVEARCSCGLHQVRTAGRRASSVTMTAFVRHTIPFGAIVRIWASKRAAGHGDYRYGAIGGYLKYAINSAGLGLLATRCLLPGSHTPQRNCSAGGRRHP